MYPSMNKMSNYHIYSSNPFSSRGIKMGVKTNTGHIVNLNDTFRDIYVSICMTNRLLVHYHVTTIE